MIPALRRAIHPWRDLVSYRAIRRTLRGIRPDVVHTHSAKGGILGRAAAWSLRVPAIVHTVHGAPFHPYQSRLARLPARLCERWAARRCHAMVSVADAMTELMVAAGVRPAKCSPPSTAAWKSSHCWNRTGYRAETRAAAGLRAEHVVVGKVARLFRAQGARLSDRGGRASGAGGPQVRFLLVGDGVLRRQLGRQIDAAGLGDHFHFTGLVPPEEIPRLLAAMESSCMPASAKASPGCCPRP